MEISYYSAKESENTCYSRDKQCFNFGVSIIIPTRNRRDFLLELLASVKSQKFRPIEIVIVDDYSNDLTYEFVSEWFLLYCSEKGLNYNYVNILDRQVFGRASLGRNIGMHIASYKYILFLDSDDFLTQDGLSCAMSLFKKEKIYSVIQCGFLKQYSGKSELVQPSCGIGDRWVDLKTRISEYKKWTSATIYRRSILIGREWNENLSNGEDLEFGLSTILKLNINEIGVLNSPVVVYRQHCGARLTNEKRNRKKFKLLVVELHKVLNNHSINCPELLNYFSMKMLIMGIRHYYLDGKAFLYIFCLTTGIRMKIMILLRGILYIFSIITKLLSRQSF